MKFNLIKTQGKARRGQMQFARGTVETPAFMPVGTCGTVKGVTPEEIRKITSMVNMRRSAVFIIGYGDWGDYAATGDTFLDGVIEAAGGVNAAKSGIAWSISKELLLEKDPDVILLSGNQGTDPQTEIATFTSLEPYSRLSACKNGKVYVIDGDAAQRQGVRTIDTVEEIARLLYPGLFI